MTVAEHDEAECRCHRQQQTGDNRVDPVEIGHHHQRVAKNVGDDHAWNQTCRVAPTNYQGQHKDAAPEGDHGQGKQIELAQYGLVNMGGQLWQYFADDSGDQKEQVHTDDHQAGQQGAVCGRPEHRVAFFY